MGYNTYLFKLENTLEDALYIFGIKLILTNF